MRLTSPLPLSCLTSPGITGRKCWPGHHPSPYTAPAHLKNHRVLCLFSLSPRSVCTELYIPSMPSPFLFPLASSSKASTPFLGSFLLFLQIASWCHLLPKASPHSHPRGLDAPLMCSHNVSPMRTHSTFLTRLLVKLSLSSTQRDWGSVRTETIASSFLLWPQCLS